MSGMAGGEPNPFHNAAGGGDMPRRTGFPLYHGNIGIAVDKKLGTPLSHRRVALIVALLRVLHMITKGRPTRVQTQLVKYK
jgi:hypothetical protein